MLDKPTLLRTAKQRTKAEFVDTVYLQLKRNEDRIKKLETELADLRVESIATSNERDALQDDNEGLYEQRDKLKRKMPRYIIALNTYRDLVAVLVESDD